MGQTFYVIPNSIPRLPSLTPCVFLLKLMSYPISPTTSYTLSTILYSITIIPSPYLLSHISHSPSLIAKLSQAPAPAASYCVFCQTLGLVLRLRVDFVLPLSQEQQEEQEEEEEQPLTKIYQKGVN